MVAILTKYLGPTNYRGSRYKAMMGDGRPGDPSLTMSADYRLNSEENHAMLAYAFAQKMGWSGRWVGGGTREGYAFVNAGDAAYIDRDSCDHAAYPPSFVIGKR